MIPDLLPWLAPLWDRFVQMQAKGRLPHALLFHGVPGVGKNDFARRLSAGLLCLHDDPASRPCGGCRSCALFAANTHPDHFRITPLKEGKTIGVEQIRALIDSVALTTQLSEVKTVIVSPADRMSHSAANTLLKTLEEPPGSSVFLVVTAMPASLPVTIRSRTQRFVFERPETEMAVSWLDEKALQEPRRLLGHAEGAPLRAVEMAAQGEVEQRERLLSSLVGLLCRAHSPLTVAGVWKTLENRHVAEWLVSAAVHLIKWRSAGLELPAAWDVDEQTRQLLKQRLDLVKLFSVLDECKAVRYALATPSGMNELLWLEHLAISWSQAGSAQSYR